MSQHCSRYRQSPSVELHVCTKQMTYCKQFIYTTNILFVIVIPQCKIPARDWSKSRHVTFTNTNCWALINIQDVYDYTEDRQLDGYQSPSQVDLRVGSIKSTWAFHVGSSRSVVASPSKFSGAVSFITSHFKSIWEVDLTSGPNLAPNSSLNAAIEEFGRITHL